MKLLDIIQRTASPLPWEEGDNIPWHEPGFSARMLAEHLSQSHDLASRRSHIIDQHVAWIHQSLLKSKPSCILDLGCGPGLYSNRLAGLGHTCVGIDYSPASVGYAKEGAAQSGCSATYQLEDVRTADYGQSVDLIIMLYGEINVFSRQDAAHILNKAFAALRPGGLLLLEPHTYESLLPGDNAARTWYSSQAGLFAPTPHIVLNEQFWDATLAVLTRRYYVIDAGDGESACAVMRYAQSMQAYTDEQYRALLTTTGFMQINLLPGLAYDRLDPPANFFAIVAVKPT